METLTTVGIILLILNTLIPLVVSFLFKQTTKKFEDAAAIYEKGKDAIAKEATDAVVKQVIAHTTAEDAKLQAQINANYENQNLMKAGLLSVQGRQFKKHCRELLEPSHAITVDEYEEIVIDHDAYNGLGGNHTGDMLFSAVVKKYEAQAASQN